MVARHKDGVIVASFEFRECSAQPFTESAEVSRNHNDVNIEIRGNVL